MGDYTAWLEDKASAKDDKWNKDWSNNRKKAIDMSNQDDEDTEGKKRSFGQLMQMLQSQSDGDGNDSEGAGDVDTPSPNKGQFDGGETEILKAKAKGGKKSGGGGMMGGGGGGGFDISSLMSLFG